MITDPPGPPPLPLLPYPHSQLSLLQFRLCLFQQAKVRLKELALPHLRFAGNRNVLNSQALAA